MSEKLRPCPFCGGTKICTEKSINLNYCDNCSAESNVEHWNTRPIEDELRKRIAELEEQVWNLNLENERMEEAYWIDESIAPDGTLKPSVRKLLERLEKAETDLRLGDDLVKALDNRIAELEAENEKINYFFRRLRMFCIFAHWDNPNTEGAFYKVDAEIREYLSEYKVCIDQLAAHDAIERQDDKWIPEVQE